jgi:hypothetical protein
MKTKSYACQHHQSKDTLLVSGGFDIDDQLYLRVRYLSLSDYAPVYLSRKQVKKLRKQLKKALET